MTRSISVNQNGISRVVVLVGDYAVKLPRWRYGWRNFLNGLLANMQERSLGAGLFPELCPVVASIPGGWLVVMRRARPLTDDEWATFDLMTFRECYDCGSVPEGKPDSFGILDGRIVAVDYGN